MFLFESFIRKTSALCFNIHTNDRLFSITNTETRCHWERIFQYVYTGIWHDCEWYFVDVWTRQSDHMFSLNFIIGVIYVLHYVSIWGIEGVVRAITLCFYFYFISITISSNRYMYSQATVYSVGIRNQEFFISQHNKNMISWKHLNTILNDILIISVIFMINRKDKMYTKSGNLRP